MIKTKVVTLIILVHILLFTTITYAETPGEKLFQYGLISGSNGNLKEEEQLTRAQMCVLLAELYGKKDIASNYPLGGYFTDVESSSWYTHYVNYAKSQGWINGYPNGTFKPNESVTYQEFSAFILNALNYPFKWQEAINELEKIGIKVQVKDTKSLKRKEAFDGIWQSLFIPKHKEDEYFGITLGKLPRELFYLIEENINNEKEIEVIETNIIGLTEIEVKFNKYINPNIYIQPDQIKLAQDLHHFLKANKVVLNSLGDGIRIYTNQAMHQSKYLKIDIRDIQFNDGTILESKTIEKVLVADTLPVEVVSAELIGDRHIKIEFNKPITGFNMVSGLDIDDILVDYGNKKVLDIRLFDNNKTAIVEVDSYVSGDFYIIVRGTLRSHAGIGVQSTPILVKYTKDTIQPYIIGYQIIDANKIIVKWNKYITESILKTEFVYHQDGFRNPDTITLDGQEMILEFRKSPLSSYEVDLYIAGGLIKDYYGLVNNKEVLNLVVDIFK